MIELLLPYGFDTLEYSWVKATIGICMLADYFVAKKHQHCFTSLTSLSFTNHLPNAPNFTSSASPKNVKLALTSMFFMKQQNKCFTNRYFELPHEVEDKLPIINTDYIKMVCSNGSLISSTELDCIGPPHHAS
jgi:hypothetical protein